jgi:hypothetical protein
MTPEDTPDIQAARAWKPQIDPGIGYTFARARQALKNQFDNPLGADTPAAVRDAAIYAGENDIAQQEAQAYRSAYNDANQQEWGKLNTLAQLTRPELVGLGTTSATIGSSSASSQGQSSGTSVEESPLLPSLLQGAGNVGLAFA